MPNNDSKVVYLVVAFIGAGFLLGLGGIMVLAYVGINIPEGLLTIVGTLGGSLGTLLTTTRNSSSRAGDPVPVMNVPGLPIETRQSDEPTQEEIDRVQKWMMERNIGEPIASPVG